MRRSCCARLFLLGVGAGIFLIAGATPAALGLLADTSEAFPRDRGAIMGLYSVFLALGQIIGAFVGAVAAEAWAFDGILVATLVLLAIALLPLSRLRRYEVSAETGARRIRWRRGQAGGRARCPSEPAGQRRARRQLASLGPRPPIPRAERPARAGS